MELHLPIDIANSAAEETKDEALASALKHNAYKRKVVIEGTRLSKAAIKNLCTKSKDVDKPWANDLRFLRAAATTKTVPEFTDVYSFMPALKAYIVANKIKGYVFRRGPHNSVLPFLLHDPKVHQERNTYRSPVVVVENPQFTLSWTTGSSAEPESSTFSFAPRSMQSIFDRLGLVYEETTKTSGSGDNKIEILVNVESEKAISIETVFNLMEIYIETEELHSLYEKQLTRFINFLPSYGKQFRVRGLSESSQLMTVEGKPGRSILTTLPRILIDENASEGGSSHRRRNLINASRSSNRGSIFGGRFGSENYGYGGSWFNGGDASDDTDWTPALVEQLQSVSIEDLQVSVELNDTSKTTGTGSGKSFENQPVISVLIPLHPVLNIFHLEKHSFFNVHVNNLAVYTYRKGIDKHLILPAGVKELSRMLVASEADGEDEDVIEGKSQATIVACVGDPGLGKTLMAEVMAEASQKPLYKVQAAQLGLDAESLESNLHRLLRRAERWGAVVMIDEANAYIHSRGHDIRQNAVVGVFLRLLEYFRGTLLLTTNQTQTDGKSFDIDDAILSRCTAVFQFELPSAEQAAEIWHLQAKLLGQDVSDEMVQKLVSRYKLSGRSIRHLLKLASRWARSQEEVLSLKHFTHCQQYIPKTVSEIEIGHRTA